MLKNILKKRKRKEKEVQSNKLSQMDVFWGMQRHTYHIMCFNLT